MKTIKYVDLSDLCEQFGQDAQIIAKHLSNNMGALTTLENFGDETKFFITANRCFEMTKPIYEGWGTAAGHSIVPISLQGLLNELQQMSEDTFINIFVDID